MYRCHECGKEISVSVRKDYIRKEHKNGEGELCPELLLWRIWVSPALHGLRKL